MVMYVYWTRELKKKKQEARNLLGNHFISPGKKKNEELNNSLVSEK